MRHAILFPSAGLVVIMFILKLIHASCTCYREINGLNPLSYYENQVRLCRLKPSQVRTPWNGSHLLILLSGESFKTEIVCF